MDTTDIIQEVPSGCGLVFVAMLAIKHRAGGGVILDPEPCLDSNEQDNFDKMQPVWSIAVGEASP